MFVCMLHQRVEGGSHTAHKRTAVGIDGDVMVVKHQNTVGCHFPQTFLVVMTGLAQLGDGCARPLCHIIPVESVVTHQRLHHFTDQLLLC